MRAADTCYFSICSRREVGQASENGVPLRNSIRKNFTGRLSHAAQRAVRIRSWGGTASPGWSGHLCQSPAAACSKVRFLGHLWNHSLRVRSKNLNFEPIPQVMLMHTRIWKLLWRDWTYALCIEWCWPRVNITSLSLDHMKSGKIKTTTTIGKEL